MDLQHTFMFYKPNLWADEHSASSSRTLWHDTWMVIDTLWLFCDQTSDLWVIGWYLESPVHLACMIIILLFTTKPWLLLFCFFPTIIIIRKRKKKNPNNNQLIIFCYMFYCFKQEKIVDSSLCKEFTFLQCSLLYLLRILVPTKVLDKILQTDINTSEIKLRLYMFICKCWFEVSDPAPARSHRLRTPPDPTKLTVMKGTKPKKNPVFLNWALTVHTTEY